MSKDEYLITDKPLKALTIFAMPMILGSFFQQVYNMADSIIVGQFVGSSALAAVGACAALTNVFICVALGAGVGAGVLVSRYLGVHLLCRPPHSWPRRLFSDSYLCSTVHFHRELRSDGSVLWMVAEYSGRP